MENSQWKRYEQELEGLCLSDWDLCVKKEILFLWIGRKREIETSRNLLMAYRGISMFALGHM